MLACSPGAPELPVPDGIILVSIDTLRADYLNSYGYTDFETSPFLDAFAAENVLFENVYVPEPRTLTSHMSLFTGLYPHRHGVRDERALPEAIPTLALLLRNAGYRTHGIVDGVYLSKHWGFARGFDAYTDVRRSGLATSLPMALDWLERHGSEPFFLFLHTYDVHSDGKVPFYRSPPPFAGRFSARFDSELQTDDPALFNSRYRDVRGRLSEDDKRYVRATYAEGVSFVDAQLGRFFRELRKRGLDERVLIVIWSDHGDGLFDHADWSHGELFDHTLRVPLLMHVPGLDVRGLRVRSLVRSMDLMPTLLELAGVAPPEGLDGESLVPLLAGRDDEERIAFSLRTKKGMRRFSVRTQRHHYIRDANTDSVWFFDVLHDPEEAHNLHPSGTETEARLAAALDAWIAENDAASTPDAPALPFDAAIESELRALGYIEGPDADSGP